MWFFWALFSRLISAGSNVVESHYYHKIFKSGVGQTFISSLYWIVILPVLYVFAHPALPAFGLWPWIILAALSYILCLQTFYAAYAFADTSSVASLFTIGRVFVPIFAFFLYGEQLSLWGYFGFVLVMIGSLVLSYRPNSKGFDFRPLGLSLLSGFFFAIYTTGSKYVMGESAHWFDGWFWVVCVAYASGLMLIFIPSQQKHLLMLVRRLPQYGLNYSSYALLCLLSMSTYCYALSLTKASYVIMAAQFQPYFTLGLSFLFSRLPWFHGKESFDAESLRLKLVAFVVMSAGLVMSLI